jgi:hypothetical protein
MPGDQNTLHVEGLACEEVGHGDLLSAAVSATAEKKQELWKIGPIGIIPSEPLNR